MRITLSFLLIFFISIGSFAQCGDSTMVTIHQSQDDWDPMTYTTKYVRKFNSFEKLKLQISYQWLNNNWQPVQKDTITYYHDTLISSKLIYKFLNNQWQPFKLESYQYVNNTFISHYLFRFWTGTMWKDSLQENYSYNLSWKLTDHTGQYWNGTAWVSQFSHLYIYDLTGNQLSYTYLTFNSNGQSQNRQRELRSFDGSDDTLLVLQYGITGDTSWYNNYRHRRTFSPLHQVLSDELDQWTSQWVKNSRTEFFYTGNSQNEDSAFFYSWDLVNSSWNFNSRTILEYDASGNLTLKLHSSWNGFFWDDYMMKTWQYSNGLLIFNSEQYMNDDDWEFIYYDHLFYDAHGHYIGSDGYTQGGGKSGGESNYSFDNNRIYTGSSGWWSSMGGFTGSWITDVYYNEINGATAFCNSGSNVLWVDSCPGATYLWSTGATTPSITINTSGNYYVDVFYPNGYHTYTDSLFVEAQSPMIFPVSADSVLYQCGTSSFSISVTAQVYTTYQWFRNDSILSTQTTSELWSGYGPNLLPMGNYYLVAGNMCGIDTSATTTVVHANLPDNNIVASLPVPFCFGDTATLTAMPGYSYSWLISVDTTQSIQITQGGLYRVHVQDSTGCTSLGSITIPSNANPPVPVLIQDGPELILDNLLQSHWYRNDTLLPGSFLTLTNPPDGYYFVVRTNNAGCSSVSDTIYFISGALVAQAGSGKSMCEGDTVQLGGNYSAYGGTPPHNIQWSPSAGLTSDTIPNPYCFVTSTTTYYLTVTDSLGNTATDSVKVSLKPTPHPVITHDPVPACLYNYNFPLVASPSNQAQYTWTRDGISYSTGSWNGISTSTGGVYQVKITNSLGCSGVSALDTISFFPAISVHLNLQGTLPACNGDTIQLQLTPDLNTAYVWKLNDTIIVTLADSICLADRRGNYKVVATSQNGCTASASVFVEMDSVLHVYTSPGNQVQACISDSMEIITQSIPGYTYQWQKSGIDIPGAQNSSFLPSQAGSYNVVVQSPGGCSGSSQPLNYFIYPSPTGTISYHHDSLIVNSSPNCIYIWNDTDTGTFLTYGNFIIPPGYANEYTVELFNTATYCRTYLTYQYTPCPVDIVSTQPVCKYDSTGAITITPSGNPPFSILWYDGDTNLTKTNLVSGNYQFVTTDSSGCVRTSNFNLNSFSNLEIISFPVSVECPGLCNDSLSAFITGAAGQVSYLWHDGSLNSFFSNACSGNYHLLVTDSAGCMADSNFVFIEYSGPDVLHLVTHAGCSTCADGRIDLTISGGNGPYSVSYQPVTGNLSGYNIVALTPAIYTITVTDAQGCFVTLIDTIEDGLINTISKIETSSVKFYPNPFHGIVTLELTGEFNYTDLNLTITSPLNKKQFTIRLFSSVTTFSFDDLSPGLYFYWIKDGLKQMHLGKLIKQ